MIVNGIDSRVKIDSVWADKNAKRRARYNSDPEFREKRQNEAKAWRTENYDKWKKQSLASYHRNRPRIIKERAAKRHNISLSLYESLLEIHKGCCGICGNPCPTKRSLAVDHDHATGTVRGLLCQRCNHGIGLFHDNPDRLRKAADYLERYFLKTGKQKENQL